MNNPEAVAWLEAQIEHGEQPPREFQLAEQMAEQVAGELATTFTVSGGAGSGYQVVAGAYAQIAAIAAITYMIGEEE